MEGHPAFGGTESYLSPLDMVLASLVACTQVTGRIVATGMKGAELGEWEVDLTSHLSNAVLVFGEEGSPNFNDVELNVAVETNMSEQEFAHFTSELERRCPMAALFRESGVEFKLSWSNRPLMRT
ncbi:OsmC family protein [Pseudonocardia hispaniensis]|uniref:OsmC family protein n=1 Tax=Pseudonocardia hispaniensis TaxID=904933 RepID=A0ABW1J5T6_9PSEU